MHLKKSLLTCVFALALTVPALVWAATVEVRAFAISTDITDRVPSGISESFDPEVGKLYAFTRVVGADSDTRIYHKWYYGSQLMADVPLNVRSNDWRTWSSKKVEPDWTGDWRVVIIAEDGSILGSIKFTVGG